MAFLTTPWITPTPNPLPTTSRGERSREDIALDEALAFHFDPVNNTVTIQEKIAQHPGQERGVAQQPQLAANEPKRKRPRYGTYELPFPESEEEPEESQASSSNSNSSQVNDINRMKRKSPPPFDLPAIQKEVDLLIFYSVHSFVFLFLNNPTPTK